MAALEQDVFGLDVAVDDPASMRVCQCGGHLACDAERVGDWQLPLARETVAQALALHVWHHEHPIREAGAPLRVNKHDRRVAALYVAVAHCVAALTRFRTRPTDAALTCDRGP